MNEQPLNADEEAAWRAIARVATFLPRIIDAELLRLTNLTLSEYLVLMLLSEAPGRSLRMSELADGILISFSGLTRLVERLERENMVERIRAETDGRGQRAVLTDTGLARLEAAWPGHLASVRRVVIDHLAGLDLPALAAALNAIVDENASRGPRGTTARQRRRR
ncbi:MarR family winged helix-turn-helix transcriptional regulator [Catenuloplanes atrovinosus]|uniref:DNA-binding MarR family transcriptional regulator n=1 Tax=Catenuloplanes atrovinosus TaxID=137266 RepID=A0AAE4C9X9_9ACTN|nr:MarR family transcriptional regulator [Catenuloplanes atrovinosus]MDR7276493.1 DNA-binding MarR family transcriptional regulator [Catenuloplanes atrovinosus]